jgi:hypothetical protein
MAGPPRAMAAATARAPSPAAGSKKINIFQKKMLQYFAKCWAKIVNETNIS